MKELIKESLLKGLLKREDHTDHTQTLSKMTLIFWWKMHLVPVVAVVVCSLGTPCCCSFFGSAIGRQKDRRDNTKCHFTTVLWLSSSKKLENFCCKISLWLSLTFLLRIAIFLWLVRGRYFLWALTAWFSLFCLFSCPHNMNIISQTTGIFASVTNPKLKKTGKTIKLYTNSNKIVGLCPPPHPLRKTTSTPLKPNFFLGTFCLSPVKRASFWKENSGSTGQWASWALFWRNHRYVRKIWKKLGLSGFWAFWAHQVLRYVFQIIKTSFFQHFFFMWSFPLFHDLRITFHIKLLF